MKIPVRSDRDGMTRGSPICRKEQLSWRKITGHEPRKRAEIKNFYKQVSLDALLVRKWHIMKGWEGNSRKKR